jgi:hypothetical protein
MAATIPFGLAGWCWYAALDELRKKLPKDIDELDLRASVSLYVWTSLMSKAARWRYIWSQMWACIAAFLLSMATWTGGETIGSFSFGLLATFLACATVFQIVKYRRRGLL